jgi:hypothetical protein
MPGVGSDLTEFDVAEPKGAGAGFRIGRAIVDEKLAKC